MIASDEEEEDFKRKLEELRIDNLNKASASVYIHTFIRVCSMLGYGVILSLSLCCYLILISLQNLTDSYDANGVPRVNKYKEYFLFSFLAYVWVFIAMVLGSYCQLIISNGLKSIITGVKSYVFKMVLLCLCILSIVTFISVYLINEGMNLIYVEAIMYLMYISIVIYFWSLCKKKFYESSKLILSKEKKNHLTNFNFKTNGSSFLIILNVGFIIIFACYYVYFTTIWYRNSDSYVRGIFALLIHPIISEVLITIFKLGNGSIISIVAPFYEHLTTFALEALLNLYRRFLFNDVSSIYLTVLFAFVSGIEEILARGYMEKKEIWLRKFFGSRPFSEIELVAKRKFYSSTVTSRSILELVSIILAPLMLVIFSNNRFAVDLGYSGLEAVDVNSMFLSTVIQITFELLVVYICSLMELRQGIPMSDFFYQYRSTSVFLTHFVNFASVASWILHNFKTVPNTLSCTNVNDPCTCSGFKVYSSLCQLLKESNGTLNSNIASIQTSSIVSSTFNTDNLSSIVSILGVICIILVSYLIIRRLEKKQDLIGNSKRRELNSKLIKDEMTTLLMERSPLQQAITVLEGLCRGVSPSQAKLLVNIIEILKKQSRGINLVDVESILKGSSKDRDVVMFLNEQLMNRDDQMDLKSITNTITKSTSFMDKNKNLSSKDETNMEENRNVLVDESNPAENTNLNNPFKNKINEENVPWLAIQWESNLKAESSLDNCFSWDFNVFSIKNKNPQSFLAWKCLSNLRIIEELKLSKFQLSNMLLFVEQHYSLINYDSFAAYSEINIMNHIPIEEDRKDSGGNAKKENQYHNNLHAADVFQAVLFFCTSYQDIGGNFSSFDLFSVLFAAYFHDFNHPGLNSNYMISDWPSSGISSTFGTESPLEKHHLAKSFNLMRNKDEYNFLLSFSSAELNIFRRIVTECVMATDLAKSMPWITASRIAFSDIRNNAATNNNNSINNNPVAVTIDDKMKLEMEKKEFDHKLLLMQLSIKCADVGHPSRKLEQHLEWSSRICAEFYSQGDLERSKGMKISPLCDRNVSVSTYPQAQIGFINFVSKPCFTLLNEVCIAVSEEEKPWLKYMKLNIEYWEEKIPK